MSRLDVGDFYLEKPTRLDFASAYSDCLNALDLKRLILT